MVAANVEKANTYFFTQTVARERAIFSLRYIEITLVDERFVVIPLS
jgi:hypothetical protein